MAQDQVHGERRGTEAQEGMQPWAEREAAARFRLYNQRISGRRQADWKEVWDGVNQERRHPDNEAEQFAREVMKAQVRAAHAAKAAEEQRKAAPKEEEKGGQGGVKRWTWHGGAEANWRQCRGTPCASRVASSSEERPCRRQEEGSEPQGDPGSARQQERLEAAELRQGQHRGAALRRSAALEEGGKGEDPLAEADRLIEEHEAAAKRGGLMASPSRPQQQRGRRAASREAAKKGPQGA